MITKYSKFRPASRAREPEVHFADSKQGTGPCEFIFNYFDFLHTKSSFETYTEKCIL